MKNYVLLFFILFAVTAFGQKQKEKDLQVQIDTLKKSNQALTNSNKALTIKSDSLTKELEKYFGLYTVIKDKVVKMDFNPAKMSQIIDSLRSGRDSLINLSGASGVVLRDSLKSLRTINDSLKKETEGLRYAVNLLRSGAGAGPADLKDFTGIWNLTMRKFKVIGQAPRSGIVDISMDPVAKTAPLLEASPITSVNFIDTEFAELTFSNGEKAKCYYEIGEFNKTKPYYIDLKGTKADIRMYFMNSSMGTRISFQIPGSEATYYFGQMTR